MSAARGAIQAKEPGFAVGAMLAWRTERSEAAEINLPAILF